MKKRYIVLFFVALGTCNLFPMRNSIKDVNQTFIWAVEREDNDAIDNAFKLFSHLLSFDSMHRCCEIALDHNYVYPFNKFLEHARELGDNVQENALLLRAVQRGKTRKIKSIFKTQSDFIYHRAVDMSYLIAAKNKSIDVLCQLSTCTKKGFIVSMDCRFTNAVIAGDISKVEEILRKYSNEVDYSIINICYLIAVKKGYYHICKLLSNHPDITVNGPLSAFKQVFRGRPILGCKIIFDSVARFNEQLPEQNIWD